MYAPDELTPKQREVLNYLLAFVAENSYPPSIQQLCQLCGVSSTSTIHFHLSALKKKGLIDWTPAEKRAISIREDLRDAYRLAQADQSDCLDPSDQADQALVNQMKQTGRVSGRLTVEAVSTVASGRERPNVLPAMPVNRLQPDPSQGVLPMLGRIAAGSPLQTLQDSVERIDLSTDLCPPGCYALRVRGSSMIEDHIMDEDIVIINPEAQVREGDVVVALIENETATLKRFYREADCIRLQPANAEMAPIYAKDVQVQGKVEAVIRKY